MNFKGNVSANEVPVKFYRFSASDVVRHLQDQLGFQIKADFRVWDNRAEWEKPGTVGKCYVIMRAIFRPEDVTIPQNAATYAERQIMAMGAGVQMQKDVMDTLKPFMFPQNMPNIQWQPDELARFATMGIHGNRLQELINRPGIFYDRENNHYGVYLRPERILNDIFIDTATGQPAGLVDIINVRDSEQAEAIQWDMLLWTNKASGTSGYGVTIDDVFGQQIPQ